MLSEVGAGDRLDADSGAVELELHLATVNQADTIAQGAWNYQPSSLINGGSHGIDATTRLVRVRRARTPADQAVGASSPDATGSRHAS